MGVPPACRVPRPAILAKRGHPCTLCITSIKAIPICFTGTFTENIGSVGRIEKENEHCNDVTVMATTSLNHNEAVPVDVAAIVTAASE